MSRTLSGLDVLAQSKSDQEKCQGNIAYLCHSASVNKDLEHGIFTLRRLCGDRLKKLFGPQHGLVTNVQDNMVESKDFIHPYFKLPVHSLYSNTRIPTDEMLSGVNTLVVDLQDVGTRIYTYIYTLTHAMEACAKKGIRVVVLDRPNPINGIDLEGNVLESNFTSFVGRHPIPVRHGMTIGEVALMAKKYWAIDCDLHVVKMQGWTRDMDFEATGLPWVLPSPNLPTIDGCFTFVGTVLFEGTNISEGRGTTRSLEIVGHPGIDPFAFADHLTPMIQKAKLEGFTLRPLYFLPTFQKHAGHSCGGFQIHVTNRKTFKPWRLSQLLCREFHRVLGNDFQWKQPPYEYEFDRMPIDLINGTDKLRLWVEQHGDMGELDRQESQGLDDYREQLKTIELYSR